MMKQKEEILYAIKEVIAQVMPTGARVVLLGSQVRNDAREDSDILILLDNALNALLQSEITNIAGKALETIDLSLGVDQETTAEGTERTDYSFRFAKRFWGNRVSIIVGGKVSTGENVENTGQSLIDNVSLEYRLDKSATRYVTLFYDKSYESLLEGEITEMGAGLVLRRKMTRLGELFIFKNRKKNEPQHEKEKK